MPRSRLLPPTINNTIPVERYTLILAATRAEINKHYSLSRHRCTSVISRVRRHAFNRGFQEGLSSGRELIAETVKGLHSTYQVAIDAARGECLSLAHTLAATVVEESLIGNPETLLTWIEDATTIMKGAKSLCLRYHPRLTPVLQELTERLPSNLRLSPDPTLGDIDFHLESEIGGVECAWRESLKAPPYEGIDQNI